MSLALRAHEKLCKVAASYAGRKIRMWNSPVPVVSFTFDDYPLSALASGGALLEQEDVRGTFYASFGLANTRLHGGHLIGSVEELASCARRGHELACHTFGHLRTSTAPVHDLVDDLRRNAHVCAAAGAAPMQNFAYPYGSVRPASKAAVMSVYHSARSILPGVARGAVDLGNLAAVPLFSSARRQIWRTLIADLQRAPGWLILFTHDVSDQPTPHGCTPSDLLAAIRAAKAIGAQILPVAQALACMDEPTLAQEARTKPNEAAVHGRPREQEVVTSPPRI